MARFITALLFAGLLVALASAQGLQQQIPIPLPAAMGGVGKARVAGITSANSSITLPAGMAILKLCVVNNNANTITGGLKFGTSSGGTQIVVALPVAGSARVCVPDASLLLPMFATAQQVFIDAVTAWNSANVDVTIWYATP